jgi:FeS assembly SUF system protein
MSDNTYHSPGTIRSLDVINPHDKVEQLKREMQERLASIEAKPQQPVSNAPDTSGPVSSIQKKLLEGKVIEALSKVYDPEIPVNIYELGLIYKIDISDNKHVDILMTLTAPSCPVAGELPVEVEKRIEAIPEVKSCDVELTWEPAWSKDRMSEAAILQLGF